MVRVVQVSAAEMKQVAGGSGFSGFTDYNRKVIYVRKNLSTKNKNTTVAHERGHFIFRKKRPYIGKKVIAELKKSPAYPEYKKDYTHKKHKVSEEMIVEMRALMKSGQWNKKKIAKMKSKYPQTYKKIRRLG